ncbi:MAG TPA: tetratricopeptide repeat protein [Candidatus Hydrogenedentes bacterium]|nr:tetratricopeptide repeat protein [Candidatus Hydrogenedentota bacterium]
MEKLRNAIRLYKRGRAGEAQSMLFTAFLEAVAGNNRAMPVTRELLQEEGLSFQEFHQLLNDAKVPLAPETEAYLLNEAAVEMARQGRFEAGLTVLKRAAGLNPDNADVWYNLGSFSFEAQRYADALKAYTKVLSIEPNNQTVKNLIAQVRMVLESSSGT